MQQLEKLQALAVALQPPAPRNQLLHWQHRCLRKLIRHAYQEVPSVRQRMDCAGISPQEIRGRSDLLAIPASTRRELQTAGLSQVLSRGINLQQLIDRSTSGSSGEPLIVKRTPFEEQLLNAFRWRVLREYGLKRGDRVAVALFREVIDPCQHQPLIRLARRLGLRSKIVLDVLGNPHIVEQAYRFQPDCLVGMTSAIARLIEACDAAGSPLRPRFVMTSGEMLTEPLRARIATGEAPIHDVYGCNECGVLAYECPAGAGGYHVLDDAHILDVISSDGSPSLPGEWGEVVVTSLFCRTMPIIRYKTGDIAVRGAKSCSCGSPLSSLLEIRGRTIDIFTLPTGRRIHPWELLNVLRPYLAWVKQFQIHQITPDTIDFNVLPARPPESGQVDALETAARQVLRGEAVFRLRLVDFVNANSAGKSQPFIPFQPPATGGNCQTDGSETQPSK